MSKSLFQTIAELGASAHPDAFWVLLGYRHVLYSRSKIDCEGYQTLVLEKQGITDTKVIGASEIGGYMVVAKRKL